MTLAKLKITAEDGRGSVVVNGQDLSNDVSGIHVTALVGQPTRVALEFIRSGVDLEGEGIVLIPTTEGAGVTVTVTAWLDAIDPEELEKAAIDEGSLSETVSSTILRILKERAGGRT